MKEIETPDNTLDCQWIPRTEVEPNDWNPNEMDEENAELLVKSIKNNGWTQPIVIHAEEHYIIDGEQRWTISEHPDIAYNEDLTPSDVPAGYIPVHGIVVDEDEAKISTVQHNRCRGELQEERLVDYIEEFNEDDSLDELSDNLQMDTDDMLSVISDSEDDEYIDEIAVSTEPIEDKDTDADGKPLLNENRDSAIFSKHDNEDVKTDTISATYSRGEMEHILDVLGEEEPAYVLYKYIAFLQENDLVDTFWSTMEIEDDI